MANDQDYEATRRKTEELLEQSKRVLAEAADRSRDFDKLSADWDRERARMVEVLNTKNAPAGTGTDCLAATFEAIGDFAEFEVAVGEGLKAAQGDKKEPAAAPARSALRRGMRV